MMQHYSYIKIPSKTNKHCVQFVNRNKTQLNHKTLENLVAINVQKSSSAKKKKKKNHSIQAFLS